MIGCLQTESFSTSQGHTAGPLLSVKSVLSEPAYYFNVQLVREALGRETRSPWPFVSASRKTEMCSLIAANSQIHGQTLLVICEMIIHSLNMIKQCKNFKCLTLFSIIIIVVEI